MGLLDGKTAIITGSARGIGRATAELFAAEGAQVTINDIDGDIAEQAAGEIKGETIAVSGDLTKPGACDEVVAEDGRRLRQGRHPRQQRRLHLGRRRPQDDRRAVPGDARHPHRGAVPDDPRGRAAHARAGQGGARRAARRCSARSSTSPRSRARWATPARSNYSSGKAGVTGLTKTLAKEWGQFKINVNAVAFGFVETRLTQAKEKGETVKAGEGGPEVAIGIPEQMRSMAAMIIPLGRRRAARGGGRAGAVPGLAAVQLRPRPDDQRHRRPVRRDVLLSELRWAGSRTGSPSSALELPAVFAPRRPGSSSSSSCVRVSGGHAYVSGHGPLDGSEVLVRGQGRRRRDARAGLRGGAPDRAVDARLAARTSSATSTA